MRIEDQVVSLEYAMKLKELGIKQDSYFAYVNPEAISDKEDKNIYLYAENDRYIDCNPELYIAAFTVAELGEILIGVIRTPDMWLDTVNHPKELKEADMRATILICAIENNLLTEEWRKQWLEDYK